jgi:hypothetical protein
MLLTTILPDAGAAAVGDGRRLGLRGRRSCTARACPSVGPAPG